MGEIRWRNNIVEKRLTKNDGGELVEDSGSSNSLASEEGHGLDTPPLTRQPVCLSGIRRLTIVDNASNAVTTYSHIETPFVKWMVEVGGLSSRGPYAMMEESDVLASG